MCAPLNPYLSAILAGRMECIDITGLPWYVEVASVMPRFEPGALSISINKGPVAFCTASESSKYQKVKHWFKQQEERWFLG